MEIVVPEKGFRVQDALHRTSLFGEKILVKRRCESLAKKLLKNLGMEEPGFPIEDWSDNPGPRRRGTGRYGTFSAGGAFRDPKKGKSRKKNGCSEEGHRIIRLRGESEP